MEAVSVKELWMLLGEKDVQIYQLLKERDSLMRVNAELAQQVNTLLEEKKTNGS